MSTDSSTQTAPKKRSTSETGHLKNLTGFERLITFAEGYGAAYAPSNPALLLPALHDLHDKAAQKLDAVNTLKVPYSLAVGDRRALYANLDPLTVRIVAALTVSGAGDPVIANAQTVYRKLKGYRADASAAAGPDADTISVSQQSFDRQADFLSQLVTILLAEPLYAPNEAELQPASLTALQKQLSDANTRVITAYAPYSNARIARDDAFYSEGSLIDRARKVKAYVKSVFGAASPQFEQVRPIYFKRIPQ